MEFITSVLLTPDREGRLTVTVGSNQSYWTEYSGHDRAEAMKAFTKYRRLFLAGLNRAAG